MNLTKLTKQERHACAIDFRERIGHTSQRAQAVRELSNKEDFDEADEVRISILFNKPGYAVGCELEYMTLCQRLSKDPRFENRAKAFQSKIKR